MFHINIAVTAGSRWRGSRSTFGASERAGPKFGAPRAACLIACRAPTLPTWTSFAAILTASDSFPTRRMMPAVCRTRRSSHLLHGTRLAQARRRSRASPGFKRASARVLQATRTRRPATQHTRARSLWYPERPGSRAAGEVTANNQLTECARRQVRVALL
jgi:hypothetical protein